MSSVALLLFGTSRAQRRTSEGVEKAVIRGLDQPQMLWSAESQALCVWQHQTASCVIGSTNIAVNTLAVDCLHRLYTVLATGWSAYSG
jgi:uncharacterized protein YaeQ